MTITNEMIKNGKAVDTQTGKIIYNWYIIAIDVLGSKLFKLGEAKVITRPQGLAKTYSFKSGVSANVILFAPLPNNGIKRLNDKTIHKSKKFKDTFEKLNNLELKLIRDNFSDTDGLQEIFKVPENMSFDELKFSLIDIVNELGKDISNFKAQCESATKLVYTDNKQKQNHLVRQPLLDFIEIKFADEWSIELNTEKDKNILLIGQFSPIWIATFAKHNNIIILHDDADQIFDYSTLGYTFTTITYITYLEEIYGMKFDIIVANPPYGDTGINILNNIIDNVDFDKCIWLQSINNLFAKGSDKYKLWQHINFTAISDARGMFEDAAVTTNLYVIHKNKVNNFDKDEAKANYYANKNELLKKFFLNCYRDHHYAIDKMPLRGASFKNAGVWSVERTFISFYRDINHTVFDSITAYKWNIEESIGMSDLPDNVNKQHLFSHCVFSTAQEKKNFVKFMYYTGKEFMRFVFKTMNIDAAEERRFCFPGVDWTKEWTVEEILRHYGYTIEEIKKVSEAIKNLD